MIWRFDPWLSELVENASSMEMAIVELCANHELADFDLFFRIEKALLLSAFTIRKLHENGMLSARADEPILSVVFHPIIITRDTTSDRVLLDGLGLPRNISGLGEAQTKQMQIRQICNSIIHTNFLSHTHTKTSGTDKVNFIIFQERATNKLLRIDLDEWISIIRRVPDLLNIPDSERQSEDGARPSPA